MRPRYLHELKQRITVEIKIILQEILDTVRPVFQAIERIPAPSGPALQDVVKKKAFQVKCNRIGYFLCRI